jgi:methionine synthase II (cobalamin-independent)
MSVIYAFIIAPDVAAVEAAYEKAMVREVEMICRAIPHRDLCIQWDFCHDMILWDGQPQDQFPTIKASNEEIVDRIRRICEPIPGDVELGFHLCYGDFGAKHYFDPVDAGKMVEVMNAFARAVRHPIAFFHLPIPITWTREAPFQPLANLQLPPHTELYLGVVQAKDGAEGTRRRIAMARKFLPRFGIATECGMARARTPETVHELLNVHREVLGTA